MDAMTRLRYEMRVFVDDLVREYPDYDDDEMQSRANLEMIERVRQHALFIAPEDTYGVLQAALAMPPLAQWTPPARGFGEDTPEEGIRRNLVKYLTGIGTEQIPYALRNRQD